MKDKPGDLAAGEALALEGGRLAARPGPDLYLYTFPLAGGAWPEVGRRGEFSLDGQVWPARLTDRRGPQVSLTLASGKPLNPALSGRMRFRVPAEPDLNPPPGRPAPPGAALFLDPREGWLWSATEAAGHKESLYTPESWPRAPRQTLPDRLSAGGLTFIWRQEPDPGDETPRELVEYFRRTYGRVLVVGDRPGDLEPLAGLPGALFPGDPPPDSPLGPVALHAQIERLKEVRELKLAEGRRRLAGLKGEEAAVRARLNQWTDLDDLETRFQTLGQEVEGHRREWAQARSDLAARRSAWEEAARVVEGRTRGLLGRLRQKPEAKSLKALEDHRQALASAETAVSSVRREEETALAEARRLEERLSRLRREAEGWPAREALTAELDRLAGEQKPAADLLAAESARAGPDPGRLLAEAELILALAPDLEPGEPLAGSLFPAVVRLAALRPGPRDRRALAALVLNAEKHLAILGDFTFWPVWNGRAPDLPERPGEPAWLGLKVAEEESAEKEFLAAGGLFRSERPPAFAPRLARLELGRANSDTAPEEPRPAPAASKRENRKTPRSRGWGRPPGSAGCGLGLRAFGEMGPVNPISALAAARAALNFARARPAGPGPAALILTASPAQGRLVGLMVQDLGAPPGLIFAGEPQDFRGWPKAPLVILEPAFEAPHLSHPWAWPSFGRWRLQPAWELAGEHIWLAGREAWLGRLPAASAPLAALWRAAEAPAPEANLRDPAPEAAPNFGEALDRAGQEVWAFVPAFAPAWWGPLEEHFLAAARRRVAVTIFSAPPESSADLDYAGAALKTLGVYGCAVGLASGFPGLLAGVDGRHLTWGRLPDSGAGGARVWAGLKSQLLPLAAAALGEIMQIKLITEKIGRRVGGLKTSRRCGRPLVLINQGQLRGLNDEQPLKIGCLGCDPKTSLRLDERDPFPAPPPLRPRLPHRLPASGSGPAGNLGLPQPSRRAPLPLLPGHPGRLSMNIRPVIFWRRP